MVLHWRLHENRDPRFKVSHLRYATHPYIQYQITVKLLGSFRLAAGRRHLHRPCISTEQIPETVTKSLYHSCASELTRQGISLKCSLNLYSIFIQLSLEHGVWYLRILVYFIEDSFSATSHALAMLCEFLFEHSPYPIGRKQRDHDDYESKKYCSIYLESFFEFFY